MDVPKCEAMMVSVQLTGATAKQLSLNIQAHALGPSQDLKNFHILFYVLGNLEKRLFSDLRFYTLQDICRYWTAQELNMGPFMKPW
jgi:hypothetical protein